MSLSPATAEEALDEFSKLPTHQMLASLGAWKIDTAGLADEQVRQRALDAKLRQLEFNEHRLPPRVQPKAETGECVDQVIYRATLGLRPTAELEAAVGSYDISRLAGLAEPERRAELVDVLVRQRAYGEKKEHDRASKDMIETFVLVRQERDHQDGIGCGTTGGEVESTVLGDGQSSRQLLHLGRERLVPGGVVEEISSEPGIFWQNAINKKYTYRSKKKRVIYNSGNAKKFLSVMKRLRAYVTKPATTIPVRLESLFVEGPRPYKKIGPALQFALQSLLVLRESDAAAPDEILIPHTSRSTGCLRLRVRGDAARALLGGARADVDRIIAKGFLRTLERDHFHTGDVRSGHMRAALVIAAADEDWRSSGACLADLFVTLRINAPGRDCVDAERFPTWFSDRFLSRVHEYFGSELTDIAFFEQCPAAFAALAFESGEIRAKHATQQVKGGARDLYEAARRGFRPPCNSSDTEEAMAA